MGSACDDDFASGVSTGDVCSGKMALRDWSMGGREGLSGLYEVFLMCLACGFLELRGTGNAWFGVRLKISCRPSTLRSSSAFGDAATR